MMLVLRYCYFCIHNADVSIDDGHDNNDHHKDNKYQAPESGKPDLETIGKK